LIIISHLNIVNKNPPLRSFYDRVGEMQCPKISLFERSEFEIFNGMSRTLGKSDEQGVAFGGTFCHQKVPKENIQEIITF